jgi:hypothetical protein
LFSLVISLQLENRYHFFQYELPLLDFNHASRTPRRDQQAVIDNPRFGYAPQQVPWGNVISHMGMRYKMPTSIQGQWRSGNASLDEITG